MAERDNKNGQKQDRVPPGRGKGGQFTPGSEEARELGREGGRASSGSFEKGSERAREAGRKGGESQGR